MGELRILGALPTEEEEGEGEGEKGQSGHVQVEVLETEMHEQDPSLGLKDLNIQSDIIDPQDHPNIPGPSSQKILAEPEADIQGSSSSGSASTLQNSSPKDFAQAIEQETTFPPLNPTSPLVSQADHPTGASTKAGTAQSALPPTASGGGTQSIQDEPKNLTKNQKKNRKRSEKRRRATERRAAGATAAGPAGQGGAN